MLELTGHDAVVPDRPDQRELVNYDREARRVWLGEHRLPGHARIDPTLDLLRPDSRGAGNEGCRVLVGLQQPGDDEVVVLTDRRG